jgi:hypothetical protein
VTHLPGSRNPTDPLSRRGFADGDGPAASTGDADAESQQELFSRLGRDAPASALLDAVRTGRRGAPALAMLSAVRARLAGSPGGGRNPLSTARGGGGLFPPCLSMFVALAGAELSLGTGTTPAPSPPVPSDDLFLSPTFVQTLATELAVDEVFGPIVRGAAAALGQLVDQLGRPIVGPTRSPKGGTFLVLCCLLYSHGQGETDRLCIPAGAGLRAQVLRECHDGPLGGHFGRTKTGSLVRRLAFWVGQDVAEYVRRVTSPSTCARVRRASAPRRSTAAHAGSSTRYHCHRGEAG